MESPGERALHPAQGARRLLVRAVLGSARVYDLNLMGRMVLAYCLGRTYATIEVKNRTSLRTYPEDLLHYQSALLHFLVRTRNEMTPQITCMLEMGVLLPADFCVQIVRLAVMIKQISRYLVS